MAYTEKIGDGDMTEDDNKIMDIAIENSPVDKYTFNDGMIFCEI